MLKILSMENFNRSNSDIFSMDVDDQAKISFLEMARWTKFLAILGFIALGIMIIAGIVLGLVISSSPMIASQLGPLAGIGGIGIMLVYVLLAGIMFYPTYALLKYAGGMKTALNSNNKQKFNEAVAHLKNFFKFYGIMMIIFLGLYGIAMVVGVLGAMGR